MISFANPYGSRVATLVVWGGEWEVQEGLGRASKPSPTLLAPAERVLLKLQIVRIILFVNKISLKRPIAAYSTESASVIVFSNASWPYLST